MASQGWCKKDTANRGEKQIKCLRFGGNILFFKTSIKTEAVRLIISIRWVQFMFYAVQTDLQLAEDWFWKATLSIFFRLILLGRVIVNQ